MAASSPRSAEDLMVHYARYHRDRRNISTHFVGIPMIVFAIGVLLARAQFSVGSQLMTAAWLVWLLSTFWYLTRGQLLLGASTALLNAALLAAAEPLAGGSTAAWLGWGLGLFFAGWLIQFVGHYYEGKKPAFVDDLVGLLVGPMFIVAEALFAAGWGRKLLAEIERQAGPTFVRDLTHPA